MRVEPNLEPVIGYRTDEFPAFFSRTSGLAAGLRLESAAEIAAMYAVHRDLGLEQGFLVANPISEADEIPASEIESYLERAIKEQVEQEIEGKLVTPFLLSRVLELSGGKSLTANISLVKNNVRLACAIAGELCRE